MFSAELAQFTDTRNIHIHIKFHGWLLWFYIWPTSLQDGGDRYGSHAWAALLSCPADFFFFLTVAYSKYPINNIHLYKHWTGKGSKFLRNWPTPQKKILRNWRAQYMSTVSMVEYTATVVVPLPTCLVTNMQGFLYSRRTKQTVTSIVCTIYCRTVYGGLTDERLSSRRHRTPLF